MKIEEGKYTFGPGEWRTRDGCCAYIWGREGRWLKGIACGRRLFWRLDGRYLDEGTHPNDLIDPWDEVGEEDMSPAAHAEEIRRLTDQRDMALSALWNRDKGSRDMIRSDFPDFAARMEKPASERQKLAERLKDMAAKGMIDVRFDVAGEADDLEAVCGEVNRALDAIVQGKAEPLNFGDSQRHAAEREKFGHKMIKRALPIHWTEGEGE